MNLFKKKKQEQKNEQSILRKGALDNNPFNIISNSEIFLAIPIVIFWSILLVMIYLK